MKIKIVAPLDAVGDEGGIRINIEIILVMLRYARHRAIYSQGPRFMSIGPRNLAHLWR
jgi:hypothetical protein